MDLDDFPFELEQLRREHYRQHPFQSMQYDLALIDMSMPDIDGLAVCRRLREAAVTVPLLMLTARGDVKERIAAFRDAGVTTLLATPLTADGAEYVSFVELLQQLLD